MMKLDDDWLHKIGLGELPASAKNAFLQHSYNTLEMRVGLQLASQMADWQLDAFEAFIDAKDDAGALAWLETNFPEYKQVVADTFAALEQEIEEIADQILAAEGVTVTPGA